MGRCVCFGAGCVWFRNWQTSLRVIGAWDGYGCVLSVPSGSPILQKCVLFSVAQGVLGTMERTLGGHPFTMATSFPLSSASYSTFSLFFTPVWRLPVGFLHGAHSRSPHRQRCSCLTAQGGAHLVYLLYGCLMGSSVSASLFTPASRSSGAFIFWDFLLIQLSIFKCNDLILFVWIKSRHWAHTLFQLTCKA